MLPVTQLIKDIKETGKGNEWIYKIAALLENVEEGSWLLVDNSLRASFTIQKKDGYVSINGGRISNDLTAEYVIEEAMILYKKYFYEVYERCKTENISLKTPDGFFFSIDAVENKYKRRAVIEDKLVNIANMDKVLDFLKELSDKYRNDRTLGLGQSDENKSDFRIFQEFFNAFLNVYGEGHDLLPTFIKREPLIHGERNNDDKFIINGKTYTNAELRPNRRTPKDEKDSFTLESIFTPEQAVVVRQLVGNFNGNELREPLTQAQFMLKYKKSIDGAEGAFSAHRRLVPLPHGIFDEDDDF